MPWTNPVEQRYSFVSAYLAGTHSMTLLCELHGISRKTGYKWVKRFEEGGRAALEDRPSTPHSSPTAISSEVREALLAIRRDHPTWGPKKLCKRLKVLSPELVVPATSTVGRMLCKAGLVDEAISKRRRRTAARAKIKAKKKLAPSNAPNDVWCLDFKGDFRLGDRSKCYPLTITDNCTRYLLGCQALTSIHLEGVLRTLTKVFKAFGLPRHIRTDNGAPFGGDGVLGLSFLSVWLIRHGIEPEHIDPGRPDQNGRHERMHRPLKQETARPPRGTRLAQQRAFNAFRRCYNEERPHEGIGLVTPATLYEKSQRSLTAPVSPAYPGYCEVRRVKRQGHFRWKKRAEVYVGKAFRGEPIGLREVDDGIWLVSYGSRDLGVLDERNRAPNNWIKLQPLNWDAH